MRLSEGVEWGLHCCVVLALLPEGTALPSARLAEYHGVPASSLSKHLQALAGAGVIESVPGRNGGYRLARRPGDISMLEVVEALEGTEPAFRCAEIRRRGPAAVPAREYRTVCGIAKVMYRAEEAWRAELAATSVGDIVAEMAGEVSPKAAVKAAAWFQEVLR